MELTRHYKPLNGAEHPDTRYEDVNTLVLTENETENEIQKEIWSIKKTVVIVWCCGVLSNAPVYALLDSSSSLFHDEGLGVASLAANGVGQFLVAAVLLSYSTKTWGMRNILVITFWLPVFYIASFVYPSWATTLPAGFILGISQGTVNSMAMYGNALAYYYARLTKTRAETILFAMSGCLGSTLGGGILFGNVLIFLFLSQESKYSNSTVHFTNVSCGASYCNEKITEFDYVNPPDPKTYYTMVGTFFVLAICGALSSFSIRDFSHEFGYARRKKSEWLAIVKETWFLIKAPRGYLLIPITMFGGVESAFITSEFTKAYVTCSLGIAKVGMIISVYGGSQIVFFLLQGLVVRYLGRIVVIALGCATLLVCFITFLFWHPNPDDIEVFFVVVIVCSAAEGILYPTAFGMYGILFEDNIEGAVSSGAFWWAVGYTIAFLWSPYICVYMKLYLTMATCCVGLFCYLLLECFIHKVLI